MIGIYTITNKINGKIYVGQSINIDKRWKIHLYYLRKGTHCNSHFQSAWTKYGEDNFTFKVIEECLVGDLDDLEISWIKQYNSTIQTLGYNLTSGGNALRGKANPFYGHKHTDKTKKILSVNHMGIVRTSESIAKQQETRGDKYVGENSGNNLLTEIQVIDVITMLKADISMINISHKLNINYNLIKAIKQKRNWKYLTKDITFSSIDRRGSARGEDNASILKNLQVEEIITLLLEGKTRTKDIAEKYGVSKSTIEAIKHKRLWRHLTIGMSFPMFDSKGHIKTA